MSGRSLLIPFLLLLAVHALGQEPTEKELMGLKGEVKIVRTKYVEVTQKDGRQVERPFASESLLTLDRLGRKTEEAFYDPDGTPYRREVFTYDEAGNRTQKEYRSDGQLVYEANSKMEFDKGGGTSRRTTDGASHLFRGDAGKLHSETVLKYDSRGRVVEALSYGRDGSLSSRSVNRFGDDGGLEEFILYNGAGVILQRHVRTSEGMQVSVYKDDGTLQTTELRRRPTPADFDAQGNWRRLVTAKTVTRDGKVEEVTEIAYRVITYY
jgi:hypothetical protein